MLISLKIVVPKGATRCAITGTVDLLDMIPLSPVSSKFGPAGYGLGVGGIVGVNVTVGDWTGVGVGGAWKTTRSKIC